MVRESAHPSGIDAVRPGPRPGIPSRWPSWPPPRRQGSPRSWRKRWA